MLPTHYGPSLMPDCRAALTLLVLCSASVSAALVPRLAHDVELADESGQCEGPFSEGTRLTFEQIDSILVSHREWLDSGRPEDDPRRANLCGADLTGLKLPLRDTTPSAVEAAADRIIRELHWHLDPPAPPPLNWTTVPDLSHALLSRANLAGMDLQGLPAAGAHLSGAILANANLSRADLRGARFDGADLQSTDLSYADLEGAGFSHARMVRVQLGGANMPRADLRGLDLSEASFVGANLVRARLCGGGSGPNAILRGADFFNANLASSYLRGCDFSGLMMRGANLSYASLDGADFSGAELQEADLSGTIWQGVSFAAANLERANLSEVVYEPASGGEPSLDSIRYAESLHELLYFDSPQRLIELRDRLHAAGMRPQERAVNYALQRSTRLIHSGPVESAFNYVLFELPVGYGLYPGRPLKSVAVLIPLFAMVYFIALRFPGRDGVWRVWSDSRIRRDLGTGSPEKLEQGTLPGMWTALYFSVLSAFNIGWRDLNVGSWLARIQPREYVLHGSGWVRVVSGFQSLVSVYLLALWLLSYFGRPFVA